MKPSENVGGTEPEGTVEFEAEVPDVVAQEADEDHQGGLETREPIPNDAVLRGRIVGEDGSPIAGAAVSWGLAEKLPTGWEIAWEVAAPDQHKGRVERADQVAISDAGGEFGFERAPVGIGAMGSVLVVTAPGWMGELRHLGEGMEDDAVVVEDFSLAAAASLEVSVVDAGGEPVEGAHVTLRGIAGPPQWGGVENEPSQQDLLRFLRRTGTSDGSGRVIFGALPGRGRLDARIREQRSMPWRGEGTGQVTLTLAETFAVHGTVASTQDVSGSPVQPRLSVMRYFASGWKEVLSEEIDLARPFGPLAVPIAVEGEPMLLRVVASPFVPLDYPFNAPPPGDELVVNLRLELGETLWMAPVVAGSETTAQPEVVTDGRIRALWKVEGLWVVHWFGADPDGIIEINSVPAGEVRVQAFAPGFVPSVLQILNVPLDPPTTFAIPVVRGGTLSGVVTEEVQGIERPCEDFSVYLWPVNRQRQRSVYSFEGRRDGTFEIEGVPAEEIMVTAATPELPAPTPVLATVELGEGSEIALHLKPGGTIRARVIDGATGEPIADARAQLYLEGSSGAVAPWGLEHDAGRDGRLKLVGGVPGVNHVFFQAEGYASSYETAMADGMGNVDFGQVRLARPTSLVVELAGLDARPDLARSRIRMRTEQMNKLSADRLSGADSFEFQDVSAGPTTIRIETGGPVSRAVDTHLSPQEAKHVVVQFAGSPLEVKVEASRSGEREDAAVVGVAYFDPAGDRHIHTVELAADATARFIAVPPGRLQISALSRRGDRLGDMTFVKRAGETQVAELMVGEEGPLIRVLDAEDQPVQGAYVVAVGGELGDEVRYLSTGSDGTCRLFGLPGGPLVLNVKHSSKGSRFGVRREHPGELIEVRLDPRRNLDFYVHDGEEPIEFAVVRILASGQLSLASRSTDRNGLARFDGVGDGRVEFALEGPYIWPTTGSIDVSQENSEIDVRVWRTGSLRFECRAEGGELLEGTTLEIEHRSLGESLDDWMAGGKLPVEVESRTDAQGVLELGGIPRGVYSWRAHRTGYETLSGEAVLVPGEHGLVEITLRPLQGN